MAKKAKNDDIKGGKQDTYQAGGSDSDFSLKDLKDLGIKKVNVDNFQKGKPGHDLAVNLGFTEDGSGVEPIDPPGGEDGNPPVGDQPGAGGAPTGDLSAFLTAYASLVKDKNGDGLADNPLFVNGDNSQVLKTDKKGNVKDKGTKKGNPDDLKYPEVAIDVDDITYDSLFDAVPGDDVFVVKQLIALGVDYVRDNNGTDNPLDDRQTNLHDYLKTHGGG